jgi:hypothetical protein
MKMKTEKYLEIYQAPEVEITELQEAFALNPNEDQPCSTCGPGGPGGGDLPGDW